MCDGADSEEVLERELGAGGGGGPLLLCCGLREAVASVSPSVSLDVCEFGGEACPPDPNTRAAGTRVRRISGPLLADCRGTVMAQFSHGPCFLVTVSSYVRRKLESRRGCGGPWGLPGGVSRMEDGRCPFVEVRGSEVGMVEDRMVMCRSLSFTSRTPGVGEPCWLSGEDE